MDKLPPLQGLYYFHLAAARGSFKQAAQELFVTPAAISQQIRQLEETLGVRLFIRQHRKNTLTSEGELLAREVAQGFTLLQNGVRQINQDPHPNQFSLSTQPSFAQHWLVPRLGNYRQRYPELELLIEPTNSLINFQQSTIDLCVRYGCGDYANVQSHYLMNEVLYPVCHPLYQKQHGIYQLSDLPRAELIEDSWPDIDWRIWLETIGQMPKATLRYSGSQFVLEGALAVQGVALVKHSLAWRYLQEGKLVRIGDLGIKPIYQYYLCAPTGYFRRPKVEQFCDWISAQVTEFETQAPWDFNVVDAKY
ncbi:LysR substrate-binding domain-containing protein [Vibrio agarilyticus]|nr:LysR substrate-binding domain-containing protein [Vibrio agarilyticus]